MHSDCNAHRQLDIILTNLKGAKKNKSHFQLFPKYSSFKEIYRH